MLHRGMVLEGMDSKNNRFEWRKRKIVAITITVTITITIIITITITITVTITNTITITISARLIVGILVTFLTPISSIIRRTSSSSSRIIISICRIITWNVIPGLSQELTHPL